MKSNKTYVTGFLICCFIFPSLLKAQDFSALYEALNPSVVTILTKEYSLKNGAIQEAGALGTGTIIDAKGLILTAAHVVASADRIMVKTHDGQILEAEVISSVSTADVALIKLRKAPLDLPVAKLGNSDSLKIGEQIFIIGAPYGLEHSFSAGHISRKEKRGMILAGVEMEFLQTDAAINHGNSGGPMFNMKGEVIGIVSSILTQSGGFEGIGFAASVGPAKKILLEGSPLWTGFEGLFLNEELAKIFNVSSGGGVLVQRVLSGSMADQAGLRGGLIKATILGEEVWLGGDIIISIQQQVCNSPHSLSNIKTDVENLGQGDSITMQILRGGKVIDLFLNL